MKKTTPASSPDAYVAGLAGWQRVRGIDPLLKPGGKYEMATRPLQEGDEVSVRLVRRLTQEAVRLNQTLGDPTRLS